MNHQPARQSLVDATEAVLLRRLKEGQWTKVLPGELRLCEELNVSRKTLRAALHRLVERGLLESGQGRRRLLKQPPRRGSSNARGFSGVTLLVADAPERQGAFFLAVVDALRRRLGRSDLPLEVLAAPRCFSRRAEAELTGLRAEREGRLWLLWSAPEQVHRWFAHHAVPHVVAGSRFAGTGVAASCVEVDYQAVGAHAAGVLLRRGHRRLVVLAPRREAAGVQRAIAGFVDRCGRASRPVVCEVLRHEPLSDHISSVVRHGGESTGWFVIESRAALTLLTLKLGEGKAVPEELSILAADGDELLAYARPEISRYAMSPTIYARWLGRQLLALHGGRCAKDRVLFPEWITGGSVAAALGEG